MPSEIESAVVGDLRRPTNLAEAFRDVDAVIHSAGLAHVDATVTEQTYREVNAGTTDILAKASRQAGVRKFILLSSVRAQVGPASDEVVTEELEARPTDAYGRSKYEAEQLLQSVDVPSVVLRPVLVHGPGMRFNMADLLRLARSPWPLPVGGFKARRSIVARDHLAAAVLLALGNSDMDGETYLVADPDPLTIGEMVAAMRAAWGRRAGVVTVPTNLAAVLAGLAGRKEQVTRAGQRLEVNPAKLIAAGWKPGSNAFAALSETARLVG